MHLNAYALGMPLLVTCLAGLGTTSAEAREGVTQHPRPAPHKIIMGEDETVDSIISKILENFKLRGYDKLGDWTMSSPITAYQRPYLDSSVIKHLHIPGELDHEYNIAFRIDFNNVKTADMSRGVLHVTCLSRCIDVWYNGQYSAHDYFWINAITIPNKIDTTSVNRAFRHLLQFYPIRYESSDVVGRR
jgi:hypothetical protein